MEKNMPRHGEFCWNELMTSDVKKSKEFYQSLFGWEFQERGVENRVYTMIKVGGKDRGGIMQIPADQSNKIPPHWMTYINVDSLDQSVKKAEKLGAKIIVPAKQVEDFGRFSIIQDPAGAHIALWECTQSCG